MTKQGTAANKGRHKNRGKEGRKGPSRLVHAAKVGKKNSSASVKRKTLLWALAAVLFFVALQAWGWLRDNRLPNFSASADIYVCDTTTVEGVIAQIKDQCDIRLEKSLRRVFERKKVEQYLSPGHYRIEPQHSSVYLARMLNNCWQSPVKLTLAGSLRLKSEVAARISSQLQLSYEEVLGALDDAPFLRQFGFSPQTVCAMIIPDTYEIWWDVSLYELFERFYKEYKRFWNEERCAQASAIKLKPLEVSILASIVRCESNHVPEYPQLAGVYLNRLRRGMKLQADPTIAFCYDFQLNRVLSKHLKVKSPYNTYIHKGLPPGPICCPTKAAIDAVLKADTASGFLYFCASEQFDGTHKFAKSYKEHQLNARAFQKALDRRN